MGWYPVECDHGYDHCPKCDGPKIIGVDLASGPDVTALWCATCGNYILDVGGGNSYSGSDRPAIGATPEMERRRG